MARNRLSDGTSQVDGRACWFLGAYHCYVNMRLHAIALPCSLPLPTPTVYPLPLLCFHQLRIKAIKKLKLLTWTKHFIQPVMPPGTTQEGSFWKSDQSRDHDRSSNIVNHRLWPLTILDHYEPFFTIIINEPLSTAIFPITFRHHQTSLSFIDDYPCYIHQNYHRARTIDHHYNMTPKIAVTTCNNPEITN